MAAAHMTRPKTAPAPPLPLRHFFAHNIPVILAFRILVWMVIAA